VLAPAGLVVEKTDVSSARWLISGITGYASPGIIWIDVRREEEARQLLDDAGLPQPGSGASLVDRSEPFCPECGEDLGGDEPKLCANCGTPLVWIDVDDSVAGAADRHCPECGEVLSAADVDRCPACGATRRVDAAGVSNDEPLIGAPAAGVGRRANAAAARALSWLVIMAMAGAGVGLLVLSVHGPIGFIVPALLGISLLAVGVVRAIRLTLTPMRRAEREDSHDPADWEARTGEDPRDCGARP
jgi:ribosomal protein S27AE